MTKSKTLTINITEFKIFQCPKPSGKFTYFFPVHPRSKASLKTPVFYSKIIYHLTNQWLSEHNQTIREGFFFFLSKTKITDLFVLGILLVKMIERLEIIKENKSHKRNFSNWLNPLFYVNFNTNKSIRESRSLGGPLKAFNINWHAWLGKLDHIHP